MGNFSRKKVLKLAKGFTGRSKNCYGLALRKVHRALQYAYRDRKVKKRLMRRSWIHSINAAVREHGINYSRFVCGLNRSNVELDRKILADLAINEPFSFKAVVEEVNKQTDLQSMIKASPKYLATKGLNYAQAMQAGYLRQTRPTPQEIAEIEKQLIEPKVNIYGLRFPERDAKKEADYMRLSYKEEDDLWRKEQERLTLTEKEQKKFPREVLQDGWDEDMKMYAHKRKP